MIAGAKPGYLAEVRDCGSGDVNANSCLIAAAPDLLRAAKNFVQWFACDRIGSRPTAELEDALSAIAKATGCAMTSCRLNDNALLGPALVVDGPAHAGDGCDSAGHSVNGAAIDAVFGRENPTDNGQDVAG